MARADLLVRLIQSALQGDRARARKVAESVIAEERSKGHTVLADKLDAILQSPAPEPPRTNGPVLVDQRVDNLIREVERGDTHETGEIKRVVSSLLMQIDGLPTHVVAIGATNHPELLDRAAWRRFQVRMELPKPTQAALATWFDAFAKRIGVPLEYAPATLAKRLAGSSFAEAEEFGMSAFRQYVLEQPDAKMKPIVARVLSQWPARSARSKKA